MKTWQIVGLAVYEVLCAVLALVGAPLVCAFARWDAHATTWTGGAPNNGPAVVRGDLPGWARWWGTFDERLPGGMYEDTVVAVYDRAGPYWCSVYWLLRNRMFGLTADLFGRVLAKDEEPRGYERRTLGPLMVGWGWKKYRATPLAHWQDGPFIEVPSFTVRLARNG